LLTFHRYFTFGLDVLAVEIKLRIAAKSLATSCKWKPPLYFEGRPEDASDGRA
jgi:hypothetical protein